MSEASGRWQPMETDNATIHRCMNREMEEQTPPKTPQTQPSVSANTMYEIAELKKRVTAIEAWIKKVSESAVMNL